jgi:hypothetical protein
MARTFVVLGLSLWASSAFAQSIYVGAGVGSDTILASSIEAEGVIDADTGGTTTGLSFRAGIELGQRWGAEVEVAHALTLERSNPNEFPRGGVFGVLPPGFVPRFRVDSEQEATAVNPLAWVSYAASARVEVVLVAGASFNRTVVEHQLQFDPSVLAGFPPGSVGLVIGPERTRITTYDVGPLVGIETRVAFGDHFRLVPAFRMSSAGVGWSLRPAVGVNWMF